MSPHAAERLGLRAAPWLLWFAVLGGAVAWSLHTVVDWGIEETVCRSGHDELVGVPLRPLLGAFSLLFLLVSVAATAVAYVVWRRLEGASADEPGDDGLAALRRGRASFMALVGLVANVLFGIMILLSGIAVLVIPVCAG